MVHKDDGNHKYFTQSKNGLYYLSSSALVTRETDHGEMLVNTVEDNKSKYTNRDYSRAVLARKIQNIIGRPSTRSYIDMVKNNVIKNCPVTIADIIAAEDIFGPNLGSLKGKTVRRSGEHVEHTTEDVPLDIMARYKDVTLSV